MNKRFKYNGGELYFCDYHKKWMHAGTDGGGHGAWGRDFKDVEEVLIDIELSIMELEENTKKRVQYLKELKDTINQL